MKCPVCGSDKNRILYKGSFYKLYLCSGCRTNFQERSGKPSKKYEKEYFQSDHVKTYGKTYQEDEKNIRGFSKRRLGILKKMMPPGGSILDIGSALGIFCDEAIKEGFKVKGLEISAYARDFAKKKFKISSYSGIESVRERFDAVTLWFTLEHMKDPQFWIDKAGKLLKKNGVLAAAVPNSAGAYAIFNRKEYLMKRPEEHCFEPSPAGLKELISKNGFTVEHIVFFGLHPGRIHLPDWPLVRLIQKIFHLGDTFELYARKK